MEKVTFFTRQDELRRFTLILLILTVTGSIGVACMGGVATGLVHYQLEMTSNGAVSESNLHRAILIGAAASFAFTLFVVFVHLVLLSLGRWASRRFFAARDLTEESRRAPLEQAEQRLMNVVEEMSIAASIPIPHIFMLDGDTSINAFALSLGRRKPIVGVTAGALAELSRQELQALVAHEIAHISNGDAQINVRLLALIRGFRWLYDMSVAVIGFPMRNMRSFKVAFMLMFYLTMLFGVFFVLGLFGVGVARLMQAAIARQREYLADAAAVQSTRATAGLLGALRKAGRFPQSKKRRPTQVAAFMMFVSPYRARSWLLRTHPKIEQRIEAAVAMTPGAVSAARETARLLVNV